MRPTWLFEADAFGPSMAPRLRNEVHRHGLNFAIIHHETFSSGYLTRAGDHQLCEQDCVIFVGTWPLWRHIQLHWPSWIPGGWCSTENLDCGTYYSKFGEYLLNKKHVMMTGIDAIQRQGEIFASVAVDGRVFVRPTGCLKVFTGRCVDAASFANALAPTRYDPATRVVVAEPKLLGREWRFVIADHQPIAVSQYYDGGEKRVEQGCPPAVWDFVLNVLGKVAWEPDNVFIMDVCESDGGYFVLELNGFSCAGFYECDLAKIVSKASEIAERAWNNIHGAA